MRTCMMVWTVVAMAIGTSAWAQGTVNERQQEQRARIRAGVQNGSITKAEAARLRAEQRHIAANEARNRNDGGVYTPRERAQTQRQLNRASRDIARQKHDGQTR